MTPEQKAAFIIAQAACLMAKIAGMQAENQHTVDEPKYDLKDFENEINASGCGWNDVINFFQGG